MTNIIVKNISISFSHHNHCQKYDSQRYQHQNIKEIYDKIFHDCDCLRRKNVSFFQSSLAYFDHKANNA